MKLAPLTRQMRLFARRVINLGSGVRLLPGQELVTTPNNRMALSWRRVTQLYEQRRVVSEADPYFEEIMRGPGMANNRDFAKAWLTGNFVPDTELDDEPEATTVTETEVTETKAEEDEGTECETAGPETEQPAEVHHKGGGWYDVLRGGKAINERPLRKEEAEALVNGGDDLLN